MRTIRSLSLAVAMLLLMAALPAAPVSAGAPPTEESIVSGRVLVKTRPGVRAADLVSLMSVEGVQAVGLIPELNYTILSVPAGQERAWAARLASNPSVTFAQPEFTYNVLVEPNDWYYVISTQWQWNLRRINAPAAWDISTGSSDVVIAIVDTGIDERHEDLIGKVILKQDYVNEDNPFDGMGAHATHVAGIAAAKTNNATGIAGVSWGARIMSVKVANHFGKAKDTDAAQGIIFAADHGAKVINLSFGGEDYSQLMQDAVDYAYGKGALIVAAAGNCADESKFIEWDCHTLNAPIYPAAGNHVLAVGAVEMDNTRSIFSEHGSYVAVVAPGGDILSTFPNQQYWRLWGTSMAAPHVSGLASLIWSVNPSLTNDQVASIIISTARDIGPAGRDDEYGYGLIDAEAALVKASQPQVVPTPTRTPTPVPALSASPSGTGALSQPDAGVITRSLSISTGSVGLPWTASVPTPSAWLSISPTSGTAPGALTLSMDTSRPAGEYWSSISLNAPGAQPSQATVSVTMVLTGTILQSYLPAAARESAAGW